MYICGRTGVFIIQCFFMIFDIVIIQKIAGMFCAGKKKILVTVMTLIFLTYPLANGNMTEEYSLPFILLSIYLFVTDVLREDQKNGPTYVYSFIYGICFGVIAFLRVNNAVSICAAVLYWFIYLIVKKRWKELAINLLCGIAGIAAIVAPVFIAEMKMGSFSEMIYDTFIINLSYSQNSAFLSGLTNIKVLAHMAILFPPMLVAIAIFFKNDYSKKLFLPMSLITCLNIINLLMGGGYNHYFVITVPIFLIALSMLADDRNENQKGIATKAAMSIICGIYVVLCARIVFLNFNDYYLTDKVLNEVDEVSECLSVIPDDEKDSVLGISSPSSYYIYGNVDPCYKYCFIQTMWGNVDPNIHREFIQYMKYNSPKWVFIEKNGNLPYGIDQILKKEYHMEGKCNYCTVYKNNLY